MAQLSPVDIANRPMSIAQLNALGRTAFVNQLGPVFELSPWIAERAWASRPFADIAGLHRAMCEVVRQASAAEKLSLIRAHPDLGGRAALAGTLTQESAAEQASAGLDRLTPEEFERFQTRNAAYRARFGFPFVICARLSDKDAILAALEKRLPDQREEEIQTALAEIYKIADLRLRNIIHERSWREG